MSLIADDNDVEQRVNRALRSITQRQYTLGEIEQLAREYADDYHLSIQDRVAVSTLLAWLRKREREHS